MRTTLDIDDDLLRQATNAIAAEHLEKKEAVPFYTKTFVIETALKALLRRARGTRRLGAMFGAIPTASARARRRAKS